MAKVKVIKCMIDFMRLPGVKLFCDDMGQEWVMIPTVHSKDYQANGKNYDKNPCRIWSSQVKSGKDEGAEKRVLNFDVVPYVGQNPDWGYTHLVKFYKADPNIDKYDQVKQNLILGNAKEQVCEWKDNYDASTNHNRQASYQQQNANKAQYNRSNGNTNRNGTNYQQGNQTPF